MNSIVTDMLQWPHRIVVPLGGIPVDTRYGNIMEVVFNLLYFFLNADQSMTRSITLSGKTIF